MAEFKQEQLVCVYKALSKQQKFNTIMTKKDGISLEWINKLRIWRWENDSKRMVSEIQQGVVTAAATTNNSNIDNVCGWVQKIKKWKTRKWCQISISSWMTEILLKGSRPTTRNYASEPTHLESVAGVNQPEVQWVGLFLGRPPWWSRSSPCQVSLI